MFDIMIRKPQIALSHCTKYQSSILEFPGENYSAPHTPELL